MAVMRAFAEGQSPPSNRWYNEALTLARKSRIAAVGGGLARSGQSISRVRKPKIWAVLSGSSPAYGFAEVVPNASGGFGSLSGGRTDADGLQPAYEVNGIGGLAGTTQRLWFSQAGDWRFRDILSAIRGSGGGTTGVIPNCYCDPIPTTLTMTSGSSTCNYGMFQSCSIQYGPTPAEYDGLGLGLNAWLSVQSFPDVLAGGALFRYVLSCSYNQFNLSRVYATSPYGSPYRQGILYSWLISGYGNTCDPFALENGSAYLGSEASCSVTIEGS